MHQPAHSAHWFWCLLRFAVAYGISPLLRTGPYPTEGFDKHQTNKLDPAYHRTGPLIRRRVQRIITLISITLPTNKPGDAPVLWLHKQRGRLLSSRYSAYSACNLRGPTEWTPSPHQLCAVDAFCFIRPGATAFMHKLQANKLLPSFRLSSGLTALNGQFAGYGRSFPAVNTKAPPLRVICRMRRPALKPKLLDAGLPLLVREQPIRHGAVNQHSETARIGVQAFRSVVDGVHRSSPGANLIFSPANLKTSQVNGIDAGTQALGQRLPH